MKLIAQSLPPGQIKGTASIGRPGDDHNLLASQRREPKFFAVEIVENQLRRDGTHQCPVAQRLWPQCPKPSLFVVDGRHAQSLSGAAQIETV